MSALIAVLFALSGCSLDRAVHATTDAGERDATVVVDAMASDADLVDAPAPDVDAADLDGGPADAGPEDAGDPDVGPPDAGPPSCDSQYGTAIGYMPCAERATECEFAALLESVRTCGTTCAALGGHCIDAYRNEVPFPPCERQGTPIGCDVFHGDDICICSRGP